MGSQLCHHCGASLLADAQFCSSCDTPIDVTASAPSSSPDTGDTPIADNPNTESFGWAVLGFFIPVAGLILWLTWRETRPEGSKMARNGFIAFIAVSLLAGLLLFSVTRSVIDDSSLTYPYHEQTAGCGKQTIPRSLWGAWYTTENVTEGGASKIYVGANVLRVEYRYPKSMGQPSQVFEVLLSTVDCVVYQRHDDDFFEGGTYSVADGVLTLYTEDPFGETVQADYSVDDGVLVETGGASETRAYRDTTSQGAAAMELFDQLA